MSILRALFRGLTQSLSYPSLLFLLWFATLLVALPGALLISETIRQDLGDSLAQEGLRDGFDMDWYSEFEGRQSGLAQTFEPSKLIAAGPFLDNAEAWLSGRLFRKRPALLGLAAIYGLLWTLLAGGVLDRFARPSQFWTFGHILESCGRFAGRMIRLALLGAPLYYVVFRFAGWLLGRVAASSPQATSETPLLLATVFASAAIAAILIAVRTILDYSKIILVTEERASALGAFVSGARFVARHPIKTAGIQLGFLLLGLLPVAMYHYFGPGTGQSTVFSIVLAFLAGQMVLLSRIYLRLGLLSGQMAAYRYEERR